MFLNSLILMITVAFVSTFFLGFLNAIDHTAPFVHTRRKDVSIIKEELSNHNVRTLVDLGSGDGNLLLNLAGKDLHVTGYENNPFLYLISLFHKKLSKKGKFISIRYASLFNAELNSCDAIYIYGISGMMERVENKILKEANKGTVVISNTFTFMKLHLLHKREKMLFYKV